MRKILFLIIFVFCNFHIVLASVSLSVPTIGSTISIYNDKTPPLYGTATPNSFPPRDLGKKRYKVKDSKTYTKSMGEVNDCIPPTVNSIILNSINSTIEINFSEKIYRFYSPDAPEGSRNKKVLKDKADFTFTLNSTTATLVSSIPTSILRSPDRLKYTLGFNLDGVISSGDTISVAVHPSAFNNDECPLDTNYQNTFEFPLPIVGNPQNIFYGNTPSLYGQADVGATVQIFDDNDVPISLPTTTNTYGKWFAELNNTMSGTHTVYVKSTLNSVIKTYDYTLEVKERPDSFSATLPNGYIIEMYKYNIRSTNFEVFTWDGQNLESLNEGETSTYRGRATNVPNSKVLLTWYSNGDLYIQVFSDKGGNTIKEFNYNRSEIASSDFQELTLTTIDIPLKAKYHFTAGLSSYFDLMQKQLWETTNEASWEANFDKDDAISLLESWANSNDWWGVRDNNASIELGALVIPIKNATLDEAQWNSFATIYNPLQHLESDGTHLQISTVKMWWRHKDGAGASGTKQYETDNFVGGSTNINKHGSGAGPHEIGHSLDLGHYHSQQDAMGSGGQYWFGRDTRERAHQRLELFPSITDATRVYSEPVHPYASDYYLQVSPSSTVSVNVLDNSDDSNGDIITIKDYEAISSRGGSVSKTGTTLTYTPPNDFKGRDSFNYVIESGTTSTTKFNASGQVFIDVHPQNSLILHYGFEETAYSQVNDLSFNGSTNIGRLITATFSDANVSVDGKLGKAIQLDGTSGVVLNDIADPLLNSQTISLWFKQNGTSDGFLFDTGAAGNLNKSGISIDIVSGKLDINVQHEDTDGTGANINIDLPTSSDGWHNIVLVIDRASSSIKAYLNGSLAGSGNKPIPADGYIKSRSYTERISSSIGFSMDQNLNLYQNTHVKDNGDARINGGFDGIIDEFKIYNKALSATEILDAYTAIQTVSTTVQESLHHDGLFEYPILNGTFEADMVLKDDLFHDWMFQGNSTYIRVVDKTDFILDNDIPITPINTLNNKALLLKETSVYQQIGYFKDNLNFKVKLDVATQTTNKFAGCTINVYVGGDHVYPNLSFEDVEYDVIASLGTAPQKIFTYQVLDADVATAFNEFITSDFDFQTLDVSYPENAPLWIEILAPDGGFGKFTLVDNVQIISNVNESITATWSGDINNDWDNTGNWLSGVVPDSNDDILVPSGLTNYPTASGPVTVNSVTMNSGSTLIAEADFSGTITYNRELPTSNWYLVGAPVVGQLYDDGYVSENGIAINNSNRAIAPYATLTDTWDYMQGGASGVFTSGIGYSVKRTSAGTVSFEGSLKDDDTSIALITTGQGYNLLGNPYPSYLESSAVLTSNTDALASQTIWVWNQATDNYDTYVTADVFKIAPGQGFFVKSDGQAGNVTIESDNQHHLSSDTFQRTAARPELHVTMSNANHPSRTAKIYYLENATTGFDNGYDGELFGGVTNNFTIYSHLLADSVGKDYAIQSLSNDNYEQMIIPLGVNAEAGTAITIKAEKKNFQEALNVYLEDKLTNTFTLLDVAHHFETTLTENLNGIGRFYLHTLSRALDIEDAVMQDSVNMYTLDTKTLRVVGVENNQAKLYLYNTMGQAVYQTNFTGKGVNDVVLHNLSAGIYLVKLQTTQGTITKKIIIQ